MPNYDTRVDKSKARVFVTHEEVLQTQDEQI
jgi:hypothetical protein